MFILSLREFNLLVEVLFICDWAHDRGKDRNSSVKFSNILHSIKNDISDCNSFTCGINTLDLCCDII